MFRIEKILSYLPTAVEMAKVSKDRKKKVSAIVFGPEYEVRSTGVNGFPRGVEDNLPERHETPEKFYWTCHAEENVISQAARSGVSLMGCTLLVTGLYPCSTCARMIIQSGIRRVVVPYMERPESKWYEQYLRSSRMFEESGVSVHFYRME